jgi:pyruvate ferredoxin oxidoreductase gamma subunit
VEEKSRPNAVLLGTLTAVYPFLNSRVVLEAFAEEFAGRHPEAVAANERAFLRGTKEYEVISGLGRADGDLPVMRPGPVWGYRTAPLGGVVPNPGSTVWNDLTTSRVGWLPVFDVSKCIHCGLCNAVCADFCLVWSATGDGKVPSQTRLLGIDYRYCKGCMRCVVSCPTEALTEQIETPGLADSLRVPLFPHLS